MPEELELLALELVGIELWLVDSPSMFYCLARVPVGILFPLVLHWFRILR